MVIETHTYVHRQGRVGLFVCECGCGQEFFTEYKTRQPKYFNKTHRARAYRARARARAMAYHKATRTPGNMGTAYEHWYEEYLRMFLVANRGKK